MRTARERALLAGVVFMLFLAGMAIVAVWRAQEMRERHEALEQTSAALVSLEHAHVQFVEAQAAIATLIWAQDPSLGEIYRAYAAGLKQDLGLARDEALAEGDADHAAALDSLMERIGRFDEELELGIPVVLEAGPEEAVQLASAARAEKAPEADIIRADLRQLIEEERGELAAERAAADRALVVSLWLLVGSSAVVFVIGAAAVATVVVSVVRPLASLRASTRAITSGDLEVRADVSGPEEVASLARDFNEMVSERKRAEEALRQAHAELETRVEERTAELTSANEQLQRQIGEREAAEDALRASEEKYRDLVENISEIIYSVDKDGRITYVSPVVEQIGGYSPSEVIGRSFTEFIHPDDLPPLIESFQRTISGNLEPSEYRIFTKSGEVRWARTSSRPILDGDRIIGLRAVLMDITDRKRAEEALRESEERFRSLSASAPIGIFLMDPEGAVVYANERLQEISGLTAEESLGYGWTKIYPPDERETMLQERSKVLASGQAFSGEFRIVTPQGVTRWVRVHTVPLRSQEGGTSGYVATVEDITERKGTEEALRASEERLRTVITNAPIILFAIDPEGVFTLSEGKGLEALGLRAGEVVGRSAFHVYRDAPEIIKNLRRALAGETFTTTVEVAGVAFEARYTPIRDQDGRITGGIGVATDVSERKRAEEALRESEAKYRQIFENVQDIYYQTDPQGIITEISPSVERYGYTREGLIGTQVLDVYENPEERSGLLKAILEHGEVVDYGVRLKTGDGRVVDASVSAHFLRGPDGTPVGVEGSLRDISERKRAEQALREQVLRDPLTGVLNHATIVQQLRNLISDGGGGASHAVAMIDVDDLKVINDTYGHQVGDAVLVAVAGALSTDSAIVGRYGGDEFVAILPGADRDAGERYRDAVLDTLGGARLTDAETGASVPVVVSIGLATYPTEAGRIEELIKLADSDMYAAKRQRPVGPADMTLPRPLGDERAAEMVGELVPLLTSAGSLNDKLRLVAHRLSIAAGYDAVNFALFRSWLEPPPVQNTFARVPEEFVEAWNREQRQARDVPLRRILERTRRPIILDDLLGDGRLTDTQRELVRGAGLRSALVAPMIWQNELIGHLSVASKREAAFGPRDASFLIIVATQVTAIARMSTLVEELQSASARLTEAQAETVMMLAAAAEAHDRTSGYHLQNVRAITEALAGELGHNEEDAKGLGLAAVLHDIGKIRVPDSLLANVGRLSEEEWELMKGHTVWGAEFLAGRPGFELAATIARSHHERWDGDGYPDGLSCEAIPETATIVSVADAFDAMTSDRAYRPRRSVAAAVREIVGCSNKQFSPRVVQALVRLHKGKQLPLVDIEDSDHKAVA